MSHITLGAPIPISSRLWISARRTIAAVASRNFSCLVRFSEDVMPVIEVVELLRQLESMFGRVSRLGGGDALLNHG